jgi:hypothetical protein
MGCYISYLRLVVWYQRACQELENRIKDCQGLFWNNGFWNHLDLKNEGVFTSAATMGVKDTPSTLLKRKLVMN